MTNGETEKGIPQHIPKKVTNQGLSKESKLKEGKNEKNRKQNLSSDRHGTGSVHHKTKTGEPMVPLGGQNFIIKGRGRLRRQGRKKGGDS